MKTARERLALLLRRQRQPSREEQQEFVRVAKAPHERAEQRPGRSK